MTEISERRALAQRHVDKGREIIDRQLRIIASQLAGGHSTAVSQALLASFERTQANFEADLASIITGEEKAARRKT